jgi:hypothetical protein
MRLFVDARTPSLNHIPADLEHYQSAMLWKSLRDLCGIQVAEATLSGHRVRLLMP